MIFTNLSRRERHLLFLLVLLLILALGQRFLYQPLQEEYNRLKAKVWELERTMARGSGLLERIGEMEAEYRQVERAYQLALKRVPVDRSLPALILQLEEALASTPVNLLALEPLDTETAEDCDVYSLHLSIAGNYGAIVGFLEVLGDLPRLVRISALDLYREGVTVRADLHLQAFYMSAAGEGI